MRRSVRSRVDAEQHRLDAVRARPVLADPHALVDRRADEVRATRERVRRVIGGRLERAADEVVHLAARVLALSPAATMARGYAVVQADDGAVLTDAAATSTGAGLRVRLASGELGAQVTHVRPAVG